MNKIIRVPMADIFTVPDEERRARLMDELQMLHSIDSPIASTTKSFTGTVLLLLRKEEFGIKQPVILQQVKCDEVPVFIKENEKRFISPLIFGSDYEWFNDCKMEIF